MATKIAVTWTNSTKSAVVALNGLDIVGFWDRDDKLTGTALKITTSDESAGTYESDNVVDSADATTELSIDLDAGSHNYVTVAPNTFPGLLRYAWFHSTAVEGLSTAAQATAAYAKVLDGAAYLNLSGSAAGAGYTANFQVFPDVATVAADDAVLFGADAVFDQISLTFPVTASTYDAAGCIGWEYYDGDSWEALTIVSDGTGSTATDGTYSFEQSGTIRFTQPSDWALGTVDSQEAYWIRAVVQTGKGGNCTQIGLAGDEHTTQASLAESAFVIVRDLR